jgi:hypothetical protein
MRLNQVIQPNQVPGHLEGLLGKLITRNQYHTEKAAQKAHSATGDKLETLLSSLQNAITHRIGALFQAPKAAEPHSTPIDWGKESIRLQSFYGFLRTGSSQRVVGFKFCELIRMDADLRIHELLSSTRDLNSIRGQQLAIILKAREDIGKVVFAADGAGISLYLDESKLADSVAAIDKDVRQFLKGELKGLIDKNNGVNAFLLQDKDMFLCMEKPKQIAKLLLTSQGELNLGLIDTIKAEFFSSDPNALLEYEQGILFVLSQIDISWQEAINAIQVPVSPSVASNSLVRADLALVPGDKITQLECQQVVLGALLSQLCQGPVGDCFAVSWAIKKHNEFLLSSVHDYTAIIRDGYLTRNVNGTPDQFFFETTIADDAMDTALTLNSDGTINEFHGAPFWQCPNLIAACRQMGLVELDKKAPEILERIFGSDNTPKVKTWDEMIVACAQAAANADHSEQEQTTLGRYAFSLANNHLLRAWETSLAAMAEDRSGDYVRDNINSCVMTVFNPIFDNSKQKASSYNKTLVEEFKNVFQKTINDSFRLVYNGSIPLQQVSSDGSSTSGGFELYQRDVKDLTNKGIRIATPEQFKNFVFVMIDQATKAETTQIASQKDRQVIASVSQSLHLCLQGKNFMRDILWAYDDNNRQTPDPVGHYTDLARTPMTSLDGDNPWEVMAIDTGKDFTPDVKTIRAKDPGDLLKWLLGLAAWKQSTEHYLSDGTLDEDSATSPEHAFNIEFKNEEFKAFLASKLSPDQWIEKTLVAPGLKISRSEMESGTKKSIEDKMKRWLASQFQKGMPDATLQEIDNLFSSLSSKVVNVHQYSQRVQDGLVKMLNLNKDQAISLSFVLDRILIESLPADERKAIQSEAVRFAKTNWNTGPKNLFFCCFFNPRTEKLDFGNIAEDHTALQPMDQYEWVDNKEWEVNPVKV